MLPYTWHVCLVLLPTGHTSDASEEASLHRLHVSCAAFRGLDAGSLLQLFKDSLKDIYDNTISLDDANAYQMPNDYFTALNDASQGSTNQHAMDLDNITLMYRFDFNKINKTGGTNNPYATSEWHGIQTPQAIISNFDEKPLKCSFITDAGN